MAARIGRRGRAAACVSASLLLHLLLLTLSGPFVSCSAGPPLRPMLRDPRTPRETAPYQRRQGIHIPRERFALKYIPRLVDACRDSLRLAFSLFSPDIAREGERDILQTWRDSLLALAALGDRATEVPLSPFEATIRSQYLGESVILIDADGRLVRASWRLPVYGVEGCMDCVGYNKRFLAWEQSFEELLAGVSFLNVGDDPFPGMTDVTAQPLPVRAVLDDWSFNAQDLGQPRERVKPDAVHTYGWQPWRDVLGDDELRRYPVVMLPWIDAAPLPT